MPMCKIHVCLHEHMQYVDIDMDIGIDEDQDPKQVEHTTRIATPSPSFLGSYRPAPNNGVLGHGGIRMSTACWKIWCLPRLGFGEQGKSQRLNVINSMAYTWVLKGYISSHNFGIYACIIRLHGAVVVKENNAAGGCRNSRSSSRVEFYGAS